MKLMNESKLLKVKLTGCKTLKSDFQLEEKLPLLQWKPFKNDEKCFLFYLKNSFLKIFKFLFWLFGHIEKNGLIRRMRLISKFTTSQAGWQTIGIHILPNISRGKGSRTMKFGQLIWYNRNILLQKSCRKWGRRTSCRPASVF